MPPDIAAALVMLHSPDRAERDNGMVELQRLGRIPDRRLSTVRAVMAVLDEPNVPYRTWYAAAGVLGALEATEAIDTLTQHIDYREGLAEFPEGAHATTWALYQIGEPAVAALTGVLSNGGVNARERAADALGLIKGDQAEQALQRARHAEQEKTVIEAIDDALRQIELARAALREVTDPASVARHCLSGDSETFKAKRIRTLFLSGRPTPVNETLCHVDALGVSEPGTWWVIRTTPSGAETSRIGTNSFGGYNIENFLPSPDGKYLVVHSSVEGVPFIQVVNLVEFVRNKAIKRIGELPVGLGVFDLQGWNDRALLVWSTLFIGQPDRLDLPDPAGEVFSWDVITGEVTPRSAALRDPVRYYCGFVTKQNLFQRSVAAHALGVLRDRSAVPCIEAALSKSPNDADLKASMDKILAAPAQ
jgi:hypothetical protein